MSNYVENVSKVSNRMEILKERDLVENFEKIKVLLKKNKKANNNPLLKSLYFFVDNNVILDIDVFWLDSYIQICDSKDVIKEDGCYLLLIDMFKSSMINALKKTDKLDLRSRKSIIDRLSYFGIESVLKEERDYEENESEDFKQEQVYDKMSNQEELYQ
ncbi:MAG: hypothetical protein EOM55_03680 [Clostridia bacterium]|nr:hypothetical protein [Clostridia bacterium]